MRWVENFCYHYIWLGFFIWNFDKFKLTSIKKILMNIIFFDTLEDVSSWLGHPSPVVHGHDAVSSVAEGAGEAAVDVQYVNHSCSRCRGRHRPRRGGHNATGSRSPRRLFPGPNGSRRTGRGPGMRRTAQVSKPSCHPHLRTLSMPERSRRV